MHAQSSVTLRVTNAIAFNTSTWATYLAQLHISQCKKKKTWTLRTLAWDTRNVLRSYTDIDNVRLYVSSTVRLKQEKALVSIGNAYCLLGCIQVAKFR